MEEQSVLACACEDCSQALSPVARTSLAAPPQDDLALPAVNLSNRLNPNNIHYDRELAARYKRMSKPEKEALWSRDREMQKQQVRRPATRSPPLIALYPL